MHVVTHSANLIKIQAKYFCTPTLPIIKAMALRATMGVYDKHQNKLKTDCKKCNLSLLEADQTSLEDDDTQTQIQTRASLLNIWSKLSEIRFEYV